MVTLLQVLWQNLKNMFTKSKTMEQALKDLIEHIEKNTAYSVMFAIDYPNIGTIDSTIFESYEDAVRILGGEFDDSGDFTYHRSIVPVIVKKCED